MPASHDLHLGADAVGVANVRIELMVALITAVFSSALETEQHSNRLAGQRPGGTTRDASRP